MTADDQKETLALLREYAVPATWSDCCQRCGYPSPEGRCSNTACLCARAQTLIQAIDARPHRRHAVTITIDADSDTAALVALKDIEREAYWSQKISAMTLGGKTYDYNVEVETSVDGKR